MSRWSRSVVVVGLAVAVSGACTTAEPDEELGAMLDTLDEAGMEGAADDLTDDDKDCILEGINGAGLDLDELATADAQTTLVEIRYECVPDLHESQSYLEAVSRLFGLSLGVEPDPQDTRCILDGIFERSLNPARTLAVGDQPGDTELLTTLMDDCLPEGLLDDALAAKPAEPGDDPLADELYDACGDADGRACELLIWTSAPDSTMHVFAIECGGRGEPDPGASCVDGLRYDSDGFLVLESPAVGDLIEDCRGGDFVACDLLFQAAPLDSDAEAVGYTCGDRLSTGAIPSCRARLG